MAATDTDGRWVLIQSLLRSKPRPQAGQVNHTTVLVAIEAVVTGRLPWSDARSWGVSASTAHHKFVRWTRENLWARLVLVTIGTADEMWAIRLATAATHRYRHPYPARRTRRRTPTAAPSVRQHRAGAPRPTEHSQGVLPEPRPGRVALGARALTTPLHGQFNSAQAGRRHAPHPRRSAASRPAPGSAGPAGTGSEVECRDIPEVRTVGASLRSRPAHLPTNARDADARPPSHAAPAS